MIQELRPASDVVEEILAEHVEARGSDKKVILLFLARYGFYLTPEQLELWDKCISFESITRARRKIQASGKYKPNDFILQARREREKAMRIKKDSVESITGLKTPEQLGL